MKFQILTAVRNTSMARGGLLGQFKLILILLFVLVGCSARDHVDSSTKYVGSTINGRADNGENQKELKKSHRCVIFTIGCSDDEDSEKNNDVKTKIVEKMTSGTQTGNPLHPSSSANF